MQNTADKFVDTVKLHAVHELISSTVEATKRSKATRREQKAQENVLKIILGREPTPDEVERVAADIWK